VLISGRQEVALELELTTKRLDQCTAILDAYADPVVESHWYVVPPVTQELVHVWHWPPVVARQNWSGEPR
jgi:hypothetical protein